MSHLSNATVFETVALWVVLGIAVLGLLYALLLRKQVLRNDKGSTQMQQIWNAIREGADAYLGRQLRTIIPLIIVLTVVLFFSVYLVAPSEAAAARFARLLRRTNQAFCRTCKGPGVCPGRCLFPPCRAVRHANGSPGQRARGSGSANQLRGRAEDRISVRDHHGDAH